VNYPLDFTIALSGGAGAAQINDANNAIITAQLADVGGYAFHHALLTKASHITGIALAATVACIVQIGYKRDGGSFIPVYTIVTTVNAGSGIVHQDFGDGLEWPLDGTHYIPWISVSGGGAATSVRITGLLKLFPRP